MATATEDVWHVLYTKPNRESLVCGWLSNHGIPAFFPVMRSSASMRKNRLEPLFPCYLFAQLDLDRQEMTSLNWTPGLRRVVTFGRRPATVDDGIIECIQERLDTINQKGWSPFKEGDRVRVLEGPFRDMIGVFHRACSARQRVQILLSVLGRQNRCEVDVRMLTKA